MKFWLEFWRFLVFNILVGRNVGCPIKEQVLKKTTFRHRREILRPVSMYMGVGCHIKVVSELRFGIWKGVSRPAKVLFLKKNENNSTF